MQAITVINQFPETKSEIKHFAHLIIEAVKEGNANPLDLLIRLQAAEIAIKEIKDNIKSLATDEAMNYGSKSFEHKNARCDIKVVGAKYDFSKCNDVVWATHFSDEANAATLRKEREALLKTIKGQLTTVDEATGETWTIYEPVKSGIEQVVITINK